MYTCIHVYIETNEEINVGDQTQNFRDGAGDRPSGIGQAGSVVV